MDSIGAEQFATTLGVTIRRVEPDGQCATYDRYNRIAYVCNHMCKDEQLIMDALLARIS